MSYNTQVITVFVSSPSDVASDRKVVLQEIQAWNQRNSKSRGCFLSALTWEDLVAPDLGASAQDVINVDVGDDYDVFLGLMWGRFGSPTNNAASGTQEEFERAVARKAKGEALRISFLFKKADIPYHDIDADQIKLVQEFKKRIGSDGAFYAEYVDERELLSNLTTIFDRIANERDRYVLGAAVEPDGLLEASAAEVIKENSEESDDQLGLFDIEDELNKIGESFAGNITDWGNRFDDINVVTNEVTERLGELSKFGKPDRSEVRSEIDKVTLAMKEFAEFGREKIVLVENDLEEFYRAFNNLILVSDDFDNDPDDISTAKQELIALINNVSSTAEQMSGFIDSVEALPRLDKAFANSKNAVVVIHKRLRKKLGSFEEMLTKLLDAEVFKNVHLESEKARAFAAKMDAAEEIMREDRDILRELAK